MPMNSCRTPRSGEVWRLEFAYEDDPSITKHRPVVVAVVEESADMAVVVKVTGHGPRREYPGEVRLLNWKEAGPSKPSTVRCSKSLAVGLEVFAGAQYYGMLSPSDEQEVFVSLRKIGVIE